MLTTAMRPSTIFALALTSLLAACGPGSDHSDSGLSAEAGPPCSDCNDALNLHCTSAAGDEAASACNMRLQAMAMGATFFIGDRRSCYPNPNNDACRPLCELSSMSFTNMGSSQAPSYCEFTPPMYTGCRIRQASGYSVVVVASHGRRALAGVGNDGVCPSGPMQNRRWALVGFDDLRTAAACAEATPPGGYDGPTTFIACDADSNRCTSASRTSCQERQFQVRTMAGPRTYTRSFCSRMCSTDSDCGNSGKCVNGDCLHRCGGPCALGCPETMTCSDDVCIPLPLD
jgi:hypothetical protein